MPSKFIDPMRTYRMSGVNIDHKLKRTSICTQTLTISFIQESLALELVVKIPIKKFQTLFITKAPSVLRFSTLRLTSQLHPGRWLLIDYRALVIGIFINLVIIFRLFMNN